MWQYLVIRGRTTRMSKKNVAISPYPRTYHSHIEEKCCSISSSEDTKLACPGTMSQYLGLQERPTRMLRNKVAIPRYPRTYNSHVEEKCWNISSSEDVKLACGGSMSQYLLLQGRNTRMSRKNIAISRYPRTYNSHIEEKCWNISSSEDVKLACRGTMSQYLVSPGRKTRIPKMTYPHARVAKNNSLVDRGCLTPHLKE